MSDFNKLHKESFRSMMSNLQPEELEIACDELVKKHSDIVIESLKKRLLYLEDTVALVKKIGVVNND